MEKIHVVMYAVPEELDRDNSCPPNTIAGVHLEIKTADLQSLTPADVADLCDRYALPAMSNLLHAISASLPKD